MIAGGWHRHRGYWLAEQTDGRVRITAHDLDVICAEENLDAAKAVIDGWLSAR